MLSCLKDVHNFGNSGSYTVLFYLLKCVGNNVCDSSLRHSVNCDIAASSLIRPAFYVFIIIFKIFYFFLLKYCYCHEYWPCTAVYSCVEIEGN